MTSDTEGHDILAVIGRSPWFEGLPGDAHSRLAQNARIRSYHKGSHLFTAGEITTDIYCVLDGRIRVMITSALGQEFAITDMEPESWLNEVVLASELPRMLDAQVQDAATILQIPATVVAAVGDQFPQMYKNLFVDYSARMRGVFLLIHGMAFYPLRARLAGWLLQLVEKHGQPTDDGIFIDVKLSQNDLAQLSLGSRQRINKILSEWRKADVIDVQPRGYLVRNQEALLEELELKESDGTQPSRR